MGSRGVVASSSCTNKDVPNCGVTYHTASSRSTGFTEEAEGGGEGGEGTDEEESSEEERLDVAEEEYKPCSGGGVYTYIEGEAENEEEAVFC